MSAPELQGTYKFVFCGTGPTECIVSGCVAQAREKVIHFDRCPEYGGCRPVKGINDFLSWIGANGELLVNRVTEELGESVRNASFQIDLFPMIYLAGDSLMESIRNARLLETISFSLVDGLYYRAADQWRPIPFSKSAIFQDSTLTLPQKRQLMKFVLYFLPPAAFGVHPDTSDTEAAVATFSDRPFSELLAHLKFSPALSGAFEYALAFARQPILTRDAVVRIRAVCASMGVYGASPFLANWYGSGDLGQGFARFSAIYGTPFLLSHAPTSISRGDDGLVDLDVPEIGHIRTEFFISEPEALPPHGERRLLAQREIFVTSAPVLKEGNSIAAIAPGVLGNERPAWVVQFDSAMRVCPARYFVVHLLSMGELREIGDRLAGELPDGALVLRAAFAISEPVPQPQPDGVVVVQSPSLDDCLIGVDFFTQQAKEILARIAPGAPFFPPPTEEEIVIELPETPQAAEAPAGEVAADAPPDEAPPAVEAPAEAVAADAPRAAEEAAADAPPNEALPAAEAQEEAPQEVPAASGD